MIGCLVISHGNIARALVDAGEKIAGQCDALYSLSSDDSTLPVIKGKIDELTQQQKFSDGFIIMVCLRGGSGWNVSRAVTNGNDNIALVSGTNLPMILSFITKREKYRLPELVDLITQEAKKGIVELMPS